MRYLAPIFRKGAKQKASGAPVKAIGHKLIDQLRKRMRITGQKYGTLVQNISGTRIKVEIDERGIIPVVKWRVLAAETVRHALRQIGSFIYEDDGDSDYHVVRTAEQRVERVYNDVVGSTIVGGSEMFPPVSSPDPLKSKYINDSDTLIGTFNWNADALYWKGIESLIGEVPVSCENLHMTDIGDEGGVRKYRLIFEGLGTVKTAKCTLYSGSTFDTDSAPVSRLAELINATHSGFEYFAISPDGTEIASLWEDDSGTPTVVRCQTWAYDPDADTITLGPVYDIREENGRGSDENNITLSGGGTWTYVTRVPGNHGSEDISTTSTTDVNTVSTYVGYRVYYDEGGVLRGYYLDWTGDYHCSCNGTYHRFGILGDDDYVQGHAWGDFSLTHQSNGTLYALDVKEGVEKVLSTFSYPTTASWSVSEAENYPHESPDPFSYVSWSGIYKITPTITYIDQRNGVVVLQVYEYYYKQPVKALPGLGKVGLPVEDPGDWPYADNQYFNWYGYCPEPDPWAWSPFGFKGTINSVYEDDDLDRYTKYYVYDKNGIVFEKTSGPVDRSQEDHAIGDYFSPFQLHEVYCIAGLGCQNVSGDLERINSLSPTRFASEADEAEGANAYTINAHPTGLGTAFNTPPRRANDGSDGTVALELDLDVGDGETFEYRWLTPVKYDYTKLTGFTTSDRLITYINNGRYI